MARARRAISSPCSVNSMPDLTALDQAHLQLVLELLDLHGERRLADGASFGRMAEMAGFRQ